MPDLKLTTIYERLRKHGVDPLSDEHRAAVEQRIAEAAAYVELPEAPADDAAFRRRAEQAHRYGRLGVMWQVILIQGLLGPVINVALIIVDIWRVHIVTRSFETSWPIAWLMSVAIVLLYTFISLLKADLAWQLGDQHRQKFSLRHWFDGLKYWFGWYPERRAFTHHETEYRAVSRFHWYFQLALFIFFSLAAAQEIALRSGDQFQNITGAIGGALFSALALVGLSMQIQRSYKFYMEYDGGTLKTAHFFVAQRQRYLAQVQALREEETHNYYLLLLETTVKAKQQTLPETLQQNGNQP